MTRTKLRLVSLSAMAVFFTFFQNRIFAQCPQIEAIMIDACGTEFLNEFVIIRSGGGFNTSDIELDYDANNNITTQANNDINIDNGNFSGDPTPCGLTTGNVSAFTGCSNLIAVGPGIDIPANAKVVLQTSSNSVNSTYNFTSLCGAGQCVYVIASTCVRTAGAFTNGPAAGTRTTNFSINGTCPQSVTYNLASTTGGNGAYYLPLTNTYGNAGCLAPPVTGPTLLPPVINPISNVTVCGDYTLPPITGTNLTANAAYFTGANGTGTQYDPGDVISTTTTLFAFDQNGPVGCFDQEQFTVTIGAPPVANQPADVTVCATGNVNVALTGSPAGTIFNWTNDNTAIGLGASGSGNINFPSANVTVQQIGLITVTPTQGSCTGTPVTFTITVNPRPAVDDPPNQTVCGGDDVNVVFSSNGTNPTYTWTNSNTAIGLPANGTGDINFTANNASATLNATVTVTASENGCAGPAQTFTITVKPTPTVNQPADLARCAGQTVAVTFSGSPAGTTFNWTNDNTAIGLGASGSGNFSYTAPVVAAQEVGTITVTPTLNGCTGNPLTFTITINPGPVADNPGNQSACAGENVAVLFTSPTSPVFNWTNSNTAIGLGASGSGDLNFTAASVAAPQTATITVTPVEGPCTGTPIQFTITVSPTPFVNQPGNDELCAGEQIQVNFSGSTGASFNWTNDNTATGLPASGTGNIDVSSANVTVQEVSTITVTPTLGACDGVARTFTITVNPNAEMDDPANRSVCGGQNVNVQFTSANGSPTYTWTNSNPAIGLPASGSGNLNFNAANVATQQVATITVTPSVGGCTGASQTFTITVSPAPTVNQPGNISICAGQSILINFSGSAGAVFNWTNSNTAIGLMASGTGNISLNAANVATQQVGTITVTPSVAGGCSGVPVSFTITIKPLPTVNQPANAAVCIGETVSVNFSGSANTTFNWTNNNTAIGLGASGSGNLNFPAANVATTQTATITVTPVSNGCTGTPTTFTITVSPGVSVNDPADQSVCTGAQVNVQFSGSGNPTFTWTNNNTAIGLGASGNGNISFPAANVATTQTATITVTPSGAGCQGAPQTFTITVSPGATVDNPGNRTACVGDSVSVLFTGTGNPTFTWTNSNPAIGLPASGSGNLNFTAATVAAPQTGTITVTAASPGCASASQTFTITVSPGTSVDDPADQSVCGGDSVSVVFTGTGSPVFTWTNDNTAIGLGASGTGDISFDAAIVTAPETATITVTPLPTVGFAYVTNYFSNDVSVIDVSTNTVVATIPIPVGSPYGVSVSPTGDRVYVGSQTLSDSGFVFVIDTKTNTLIASDTVGFIPYGLVVSPDGNRVYICNESGNMSVFDATTNTVIATVFIGASPYGITMHPDGSRVYIAGGGPAGYVVVLDAATNTVITTIPIGARPNGIRVLPDGSRIYVANGGSDDVSVVDVATNTVITTIPAGIEPNGVAISPDGQRVYVSNENSASVTVIDVASNTVIATIPVGMGPIGLSFSPDGSQLYVANILDDVSVIDVASNTVTATIVAGVSPTAFGNFVATLGCVGAPQTFTITVNPAPDLAQPNTITACGNTTVNIPFSPSAGATVNWTNSNTAIGLPASGSGDISFSAANVAAPQTATITATPVLGSCNGPARTFTVTVNPPANGAITGDLLICAGDSTTLTASGGASYEWDNTAVTPSITVSPTAATTYVVIVTNAFGCARAVSALVNVDQAPVAAIVGNTVLCAGESATLTASGGGTYAWSTGSNTPSITVSPAADSTYRVTVTNAFSCTDEASLALTVLPSETATFSSMSCNPADTGTVVQVFQNQFGCDSTVTNIVALAPTDLVNLASTSCDSSQVGVFTQNLTNRFGCDSTVVTTVTFSAGDLVNLSSTSCDSSQVGVFTQNLTNQAGCDSTVVTTVTFSAGDLVNLTATTCDPAQAGVFTQNLTNQAGCDSTVVTTVTLAPTDSVSIAATTCDPAQAGVFTQNLTNQAGCDSTVVTTVTLLPADTLSLAATTCDPAQAGVFTQNLTNQAGCDSTVVTTVTLLPADTLSLAATTCDPAQAGVFTQNLTNQAGCDSTVVTTVTLLPADTLSLAATTCDPAQAGVFTQNLTNQAGCDSTVVTTVTLAPTDVVNLTANTCDPAQAGVFTQNLTNQAGCDSTVITTVTLRPTDVVNLATNTCDPTQAGVFTQNLKNQFGCDSTVITTVTLRPTDNVVLSATTCDPAQAGVFTENLKNQYGCDSTVVITVTLLPSDMVNLSLITCDSTKAGVFTQNLKNQFGCDSTVVTTVTFDPSLLDITFLTENTCDPAQAGTTQSVVVGTDGCDSIIMLTRVLLPSDTLHFTAFTCDPAAAGIFTDVLQNQFGCDSVLISEVIFDPVPCAPALDAVGVDASCGNTSDGSFSVQILNGQAPLLYSWAGSGGQTGNGQITNTSVPLVVNNLPPGNYSITVTDPLNQASAVKTVNIGSPPVLSAVATAVQAFNGFTLPCTGAPGGLLTGSAGGGIAPFQFNWNTGDTGDTLKNITAGTYSLTIIDSKGCSSTASATATEPPLLDLSLAVGQTFCGDSLVDVSISTAGGVSPYAISVDGDVIGSGTPALASGIHIVAVTDANGCLADTMLLLNLPPVPAISLPPDTTVVLGHGVNIVATTNLNTWAKIQWEPVKDSANADQLQQSWTPFRSDYLTVTIVDSFGCSAKATMRVLVERVTELYVPNVFSPNDDGLHDEWKFDAGISVKELQEVRVFDRWGDLLYTWDIPIEVDAWPGWDGTTRGKKADLGVYVYYLKVKLSDGTETMLSGDVTITDR